MSEDYQGALIAMSEDFMDYSQDIKTGVTMMKKILSKPCSRISTENLDEALQIYRILKQKLLDPEFIYKEQVAKMYLNILKYNGFQAMRKLIQQEADGSQPSRKEELFNRFMLLVQEHYAESRLVTFYADKLCITPKYLSSCIHQVSGKYATEWIDSFVILEAKTLLKKRKCTIKEICDRLHFVNQSVFAKYFRNLTGMTPKEFKNS